MNTFSLERTPTFRGGHAPLTLWGGQSRRFGRTWDPFSWGEQDSNLRRRSQQIYSLPSLAA